MQPFVFHSDMAVLNTSHKIRYKQPFFAVEKAEQPTGEFFQLVIVNTPNNFTTLTLYRLRII